jgi:Cu+-exporting ATPase
MPGISLKSQAEPHQFDYLQSETIQQKLHSFQSEAKNIVTFHIPVIHCSSCIWLLENLNSLVNGVLFTRVQFTNKELTVYYNPGEISLVDLVKYLVKLGYEPLITLADKPKKEIKKGAHLLYLKIGISGFCFGNIMLLAFPEYLGIEGVDAQLQTFFGYLSAFLSLPVMYAASEYLTSAYKGIKHQYFNIDIPISLGILTLFFRSLFEVMANTGAGYFDSLAGLVFFLLIGRWFQNKTYQELSFERDYKSYFPLAVDKMEGVLIKPIQVSLLQPGDEIIIKNHELIPADSILLSKTANIDYSFVTGESLPDHRKAGDYLYAGGRQQGMSIRLRVEKPISQSYLTQLWNNEVFTKNAPGHQTIIDKISKYFTFVIIAIASLALLGWYWIDPSQMVSVFTAVLIVACPCALALSAPFTLGNTLRVMGRSGLYLKNASIIEVMNKLSHVVLDKTGTITYGDKSNMSYVGAKLSMNDQRVIKSMVAHSTHPLSKMLADYFVDIKEVALDGYQEHAGSGLQVTHQGTNYLIGSGKFVGLTTDKQSTGTKVYVSKQGDMLGVFEIANRYRTGLKEVVSKLQSFMQLTILSGDNDGERNTLQDTYAITNLVFDKKPEDKLTYLKDLSSKGAVTMMIGDGLNDAGALQQSDVGIVVADNVNNFTPASDGILDAKAFDKLPAFIALSKACTRIIYASFVLSFLYNIVGLGFAVSGLLTPVFAAILMPLSSITIVLFTTFMVNISARKLTLGK